MTTLMFRSWSGLDIRHRTNEVNYLKVLRVDLNQRSFWKQKTDEADQSSACSSQRGVFPLEQGTARSLSPVTEGGAAADDALSSEGNHTLGRCD